MSLQTKSNPSASAAAITGADELRSRNAPSPYEGECVFPLSNPEAAAIPSAKFIVIGNASTPKFHAGEPGHNEIVEDFDSGSSQTPDSSKVG